MSLIPVTTSSPSVVAVRVSGTTCCLFDDDWKTAGVDIPFVVSIIQTLISMMNTKGLMSFDLKLSFSPAQITFFPLFFLFSNALYMKMEFVFPMLSSTGLRVSFP